MEEIPKRFKSGVRGLASRANKKYQFPGWGGGSVGKREMIPWVLGIGNEGIYTALKRSFDNAQAKGAEKSYSFISRTLCDFTAI